MEPYIVSSVIPGLLFILGAALGSFLNVVAMRTIAGVSFLHGRSHCPHCHTRLKWFEVIPVISYVSLMGRCRSCNAVISERYLLTEVGMGLAVMFLGIAFQFDAFSAFLPATQQVLAASGPLFIFLVYLAVMAVSCVIFLIDLDTKYIYTPLSRALIAIGLLLNAAEIVLSGAANSLAGYLGVLTACAIGLLLIAIWLITRGKGIGLGDSELAFALALFLPYPLGILALLLSFWIGAVFGIALMVVAGYGLKSRIPFGPFLVLGFAVALLWGNILLPYLLPFV